MALARVEKDDEGHTQTFLALEPKRPDFELNIDNILEITPHTKVTVNTGGNKICTSRRGIVRKGQFGNPSQTLTFIECDASDCQARYFSHP